MMFFWLFNGTFLIYDLPCKTILLLEVKRQASDVSPIFSRLSCLLILLVLYLVCTRVRLLTD